MFYVRTRKRWPLNTGDCLIEVISWADLTVNQMFEVTCLIRPLFLCPKGDLLIQVWLYIYFNINLKVFYFWFITTQILIPIFIFHNSSIPRFQDFPSHLWLIIMKFFIYTIYLFYCFCGHLSYHFLNSRKIFTFWNLFLFFLVICHTTFFMISF
jgi:hypothetical protein